MRYEQHIKKRHLSGMKGFSFLEVILSTFVLSIGITAALSALSTGIRDSLDSQSVIIASGLAQEGTELIQNVRDNNFACVASGGCPGDDGFRKFPKHGSGGYVDSGTCRIDYNDASVFSYNDSDKDVNIDCSSNGANRYDLTLANGFYAHDGAAGKFKRRIYLDWDNPSSTFTVYSAVWWGSLSTETFNNTIQLTSNCTLSNKCVLARTTLAPWN